MGSRVLGANDRVVLASVGIRGQGNALKRGFATLKNVEIKTLCDIDANLFASRINDPKRLADCRRPSSPAPRRTCAASSTTRTWTRSWWPPRTTGTPWPRIWGMQAGKHVYVEKPASHTVWEGRKMVEAAPQVQQASCRSAP